MKNAVTLALFLLIFSGCSFQFFNFENRTRIADYNGLLDQNHDDTINWLAGPGVTITGPDAKGMITITVDTLAQLHDIAGLEPSQDYFPQNIDTTWSEWDDWVVIFPDFWLPSDIMPQDVPDDVRAFNVSFEPDTARLKIMYHQGNGVLITNDNTPVFITVVGYDFNGVLVDSFVMLQQGGALVIPND